MMWHHWTVGIVRAATAMLADSATKGLDSCDFRGETETALACCMVIVVVEEVSGVDFEVEVGSEGKESEGVRSACVRARVLGRREVGDVLLGIRALGSAPVQRERVDNLGASEGLFGGAVSCIVVGGDVVGT
jgi:hypothetical protein